MSFVLTAQTEKDSKKAEKVTKESELRSRTKNAENETANTSTPIKVKNEQPSLW